MNRRRRLTAAAYAGMFVFGIVMALLGALLPALSRKVNLAQAGVLFFAMNLAMLVASLVTGPLMDRFGKKPALVGGAALAALALVIVAPASSYAALVAGVVILGAGGGALNASTNTLVSDLHLEAGERNAALNLLGVPFGFGALFLPFVVGALPESAHPKTLYAASGLSCALALVCLWLRFPAPLRRQGLPLREGLRFLRSPLVLTFGAVLFFQSGNEFTLGGYTSKYLSGAPVHAGASAASYLLAAYWGSIMLTRVGLGRLLVRFDGGRVVLWSALAAGAGVALLLMAANVALAAAAVVLVGAGFASIFPTTLGLAGERFAAHSGTVFGILFGMALSGGMTLPWAVGQIAQGFQLRLGLVLAIWSCLMIAALQAVISRLPAARPAAATESPR